MQQRGVVRHRAACKGVAWLSRLMAGSRHSDEKTAAWTALQPRRTQVRVPSLSFSPRLMDTSSHSARTATLLCPQWHPAAPRTARGVVPAFSETFEHEARQAGGPQGPFMEPIAKSLGPRWRVARRGVRRPFFPRRNTIRCSGRSRSGRSGLPPQGWAFAVIRQPVSRASSTRPRPCFPGMPSASCCCG